MYCTNPTPQITMHYKKKKNVATWPVGFLLTAYGLNAWILCTQISHTKTETRACTPLKGKQYPGHNET